MILDKPTFSNDLNAEEALRMLSSGSAAFLDVRSENEFEQANVFGFVNAPVLTNEERHKVGLCFHELGQTEAIALGRRLVEPHLSNRIKNWGHIVQSHSSKHGIIACWRGGLRSSLTCALLREKGFGVSRVLGGYKAMRRQLLTAFENLPKMYLLAGYTGSGKTKLIRELRSELCIDLEAIAHHRGSSFGAFPGDAQPQQASFENRLALDLRKSAAQIIVEAESRQIGRVAIPNTFLYAMSQAKVILVNVPLKERAIKIYEEYIVRPLTKNNSDFDAAANKLALTCTQGINLIRRRLGGALADQIATLAAIAFKNHSFDREPHLEWIELLLSNYYDRMYRYAFERQEREIIFQGDYDSCKQWISQTFV